MLSLLDYVVLGVLVISLLIGIFRGFIREILSLVSWGVAVWTGFHFSPQFAQYFSPMITSPQLQQIAAGIALFILVLLLMSFLAYLLNKVFSAGKISGPDRTLGALFGLARAVVIIAVVGFLIQSMGMTTEPWWQSSRSATYITQAADILGRLLPPGITIPAITNGG